MEHININFYRGRMNICLLLFLLLLGCGSIQANENISVYPKEKIQITVEHDGVVEDAFLNDIGNCYEGEWYRADVASYQWAEMTISGWKEGESFEVTLYVNYYPYGDVIEGTATFIEEDMAVLHDENLENLFENREGDYGIYFQFLENSIKVTHDSCVRMCFGGGGIVTAEGTYIQGEPEYTNCTDVSEIFTENELELIQELLGESYEALFENMIELGEIREYEIENGRLWEAYKPPYSAEWCNILIYQDGRIYIEGCTYNGTKEFYTNSDDKEMPDIDLLKDEQED